MEDPNNTDQDLGKNSYNIRNVQRAFEHAFFMLAVRDNNVGLGDTMLGSILKWDQRWDRYAHSRSKSCTRAICGSRARCVRRQAEQQFVAGGW